METSNTLPPQPNQYYQATISAFKRIWKYKFLWLWGVLLPSGLPMNYSFDQGKAKEIDLGPDTASFYFQQYWMNYAVWIISGIILLLIIVIICWLFSAIARGGIINCLSDLQEKEENKEVEWKKELKKIWQIGKLRFWNIIKLDLLFVLIGFVLALTAVLPIYFSKLSGNYLAVGLVVFLAVLVFIPIAFILILIKNICLVYVALAKETPFRSIEYAYGLLMKNKKEALKLILTLFILMIAVAIAAVIIFGIAGGILALILGLIFAITKFNFLGILSAIIFGTAFVILALIVKSIVALWQQDIWLWWIKKITSVKTEELSTETVSDKIKNNLENEKPEVVVEEKIN